MHWAYPMRPSPSRGAAVFPTAAFSLSFTPISNVGGRVVSCTEGPGGHLVGRCVASAAGARHRPTAAASAAPTAMLAANAPNTMSRWRRLHGRVRRLPTRSASVSYPVPGIVRSILVGNVSGKPGSCRVNLGISRQLFHVVHQTIQRLVAQHADKVSCGKPVNKTGGGEEREL